MVSLHFPHPPRPASRPGGRPARRGPKSVAEAMVEARNAAGGRLGATRRAAPSRRPGASSRPAFAEAKPLRLRAGRLPDVPTRLGEAFGEARASRRAAFLPCRRDGAAQTMGGSRSAG